MAFVFSACGAAESFLGGGGSSRETTTTTTTVKKHDPLRSAVEILPVRCVMLCYVMCVLGRQSHSIASD